VTRILDRTDRRARGAAEPDPPTLVEACRRLADRRPDDRAFTFVTGGTEETERLTYGELDRHARGIAAALQHTSVPGDRALLLYPPTLEYVSAFLGCLYADVVAVPAYPPSPRTVGRLVSIIEDATPSVVLAPSSIAPLVQAGLAELRGPAAMPVLVTDALPDEDPDVWAPPALDGASVAFLQYTSGSTSTPKGVIVTHANILSNQRMIAEGFGSSERSVVGSWLPLYHDMGLIGCVMHPLYLGAPGYLMSPVEFLKAPARWLRLVSRFRVTLSGGPNFGYERCVRKVTVADREGLDLSSWTIAFNGAEPIRSQTVERFVETFADAGFRPEAMYPCYGLAEATLFVTGEPPLHGPVVRSFDVEALERDGRAVPAKGGGSRRLVSSGRSWAPQRLAVVHPIDGRPLADGEVGEIWIAGPNVTGGYWGRPGERGASFEARLPSGDGPFLRTGDLGFLRDGELFVTGRIKDLIIVRGRNHYPQDIERTAEEAHPKVRPGCGVAFGIEEDGEERLVIVQEVDRDLAAEELPAVANAIRSAVAAAHDLRAHAVVLIPPGEIPKTSSGKIQRGLTRRRYLDGDLPAVLASVRGPAAGAPDGLRESL
jgi:acyl-CoA synthetase (AMP-forming)/AMP-acid ligase II